MNSLRPSHAVALGYLSYIVLGTISLALPWSEVRDISMLDHLFMAASAVSTTGLATVDPASSYTWFGELTLLVLIQLGGLGFMTVSSFVILRTGRKLPAPRVKILRASFSLPKSLGMNHFVRDLFLFAFGLEVLGAALLYPHLRDGGDPSPFWSAIFHSVSAFCTAGFSLNANSFEGYRHQATIQYIIGGLSYAGGIGYIVFTDIVAKIRHPGRSLTFTSKVILLITVAGFLIGTLLLYFIEPSFRGMPVQERLLASTFQVMTAATTVGFNTVSISGLSLPAVMVLYFLMFFGASPAGTGGGLKSTTLSALLAEIVSALRGLSRVNLFGREIPSLRVRTASASASLYGIVLGLGIFFLCLILPNAAFEHIVFEAVSALGTVGLSMGLSSALNAPAKVVIILLMYVGRIGVMTLGMSVVATAPDAETECRDLAV